MYKIKKIKFNNHPIFGNREFDFSVDGKTYDTIIFAGPNGSKKTKLLEEIRKMTNSDFSNMHYTGDSSITITYDLRELDLKDKTRRIRIVEMTKTVGFRNGVARKVDVYYNDSPSITEAYSSPEEKFDGFSFSSKSVYSPVNINYNSSREVNGITNMRLDDENLHNSKDVAHDVNQILVDINNQDAINVNNYAREHRGEPIPDDIVDQKLKRFTKAFNYMFEETIKFNGVENNSVPIFKKNNELFSISQLSSGEKQVVFRGVELLKNHSIIKDSPVFIDEPELSMHPTWEDKIINYYKLMFSENGEQQTQMFIVTHSEHILKTALNDDNSLVVKLGENDIEKYYKDGPGIHLPKITIGEIKFDIFDVYTIDFHIELYGYLQSNKVPNSNNDATIAQTDKWLESIGAPLKPYRNGKFTAETLPTYIRNCIDHPNPNNSYSDDELKQSIDYMLTLIRRQVC